jgi:hypothetical protein
LTYEPIQQFSPEEESIINLLKKFNFFDPAWYLAQNIDVRSKGEDPWIHFVRYGFNEHRQPNPIFDPVWYLEFYNDVSVAGINPVLHYLWSGLHEGRKPNRNADPLYFMRINLHAVEHCSNACQYCSTCSPFSRRISHSASSFFPWLDLLETERIPFMDISISGGEPFLHHDIGTFIHELKERYPYERIGLTTNFYWANENTIRSYARIIQLLNGGLLISLYDNIIAKLGGLEQVNSLVQLLKDHCPEIPIVVANRPSFISWELHVDEREVKDTCSTADCYMLRADGKISHCSIAVGLENRPEYMPIVNLSKERLFDLAKGIEGFSAWAVKYPFDLCSHCTFWRKISTPWHMEMTRRRTLSDSHDDES